jgi:hypothetical protein
MTTIEIAVNTSVLRSARQKTGSSKIAEKFAKPTQSKLGSPVVTSLKANAIASRKGSATSART